MAVPAVDLVMDQPRRRSLHEQGLGEQLGLGDVAAEDEHVPPLGIQPGQFLEDEPVPGRVLAHDLEKAFGVVPVTGLVEFVDSLELAQSLCDLGWSGEAPVPEPRQVPFTLKPAEGAAGARDLRHHEHLAEELGEEAALFRVQEVRTPGRRRQA